jgi:hypothetical protein
MTLQEGSGRSEVTAEQPSGDQRGRDHHRVGHRALWRLSIAAGLVHLVGQAVVGNHVGIYGHRDRGDSGAFPSSVPDGYRRFLLPTV